MKKHVIVIVSCLFLMGVIITLEAIGFMMEKEQLSFTYLFPMIIFILWVGCAPMAYYTYLRILSENKLEDFKYFFTCVESDNILGIFFIPILLSPFLLIDYIKIFKKDYKNSKI